MSIQKYDVFKPCDTAKSPIERIARALHVDKPNNRVWLFFVEKPYRIPFVRDYVSIAYALETGVLALTSVHPSQIQHKALTDLTEQERAAMEARWSRLRGFLDHHAEDLLIEPESRGRILNEVAKKHGISYQAVLYDLYTFWAYGGTPLAFVPRWYDRGPKGKTQEAHHRKRGRRPKLLDAQASIGVALTPIVRENLIAGITKFLVPKKPLKRAYEETLAEFFADGYIIRDGKTLPILDPAVPKPTLRQFDYLVGLEKKKLSVQRQLVPEIEWQLKNRPVIHRAARQTFGPCHRYEIDATIVDIYLVCSFNRAWIIGRPVLYVVIDVWSRAVVGFHLALEGPSWDTARYALFAAFSDKRALCLRYGRAISETEWPCHHLPLSILGDRGEMISKASDELPRSLRIDAENAASFRGDWKPFVERQFGLIQHGHVHFLPGAVIKPGKVKGLRDPRLNARLTIYELGQIILECLLRYNRSPRNGADLPTEYVEAGHSVGSPIDVWQWGLKNVTGALRRFSEADVLTNLLPARKATVKEDGIHFGGLRYTSQKAEAEEWMTRARVYKSFPVDFRIDTSRPREAWVRLNASCTWERCTVLDEDAVLVQSSSEDNFYRLARLAVEKREEEKKQLQDDLQSTARINQIVDDAVQLTENAQEGYRKSELLGSISDKRSLENRVQKQQLTVETSPAPVAMNNPQAPNNEPRRPQLTGGTSIRKVEEDLVALAANVWKEKQ